MASRLIRPTFPMLLLPPATKLGQGYVFTGVCDTVHRGGLPQCMLGYHNPPPPEQTHTPQDQAPPRSRHTPWTRHLPWGVDPPGTRHPLAQSMLGGTVNARAVRILLECNLVVETVVRRLGFHKSLQHITGS